MATPMPAAAVMKIAQHQVLVLRAAMGLPVLRPVRSAMTSTPTAVTAAMQTVRRIDNVCGDAIVECTEQCDDGDGNALHPNFGGCESDVGYDRICVFGPPAHCAGDIDVPDANLASVLRSALGLADSEPIQFSTRFVELWALSKRGISDLTGLGCFVHLRDLYLYGNQDYDAYRFRLLNLT